MNQGFSPWGEIAGSLEEFFSSLQPPSRTFLLRAASILHLRGLYILRLRVDHLAILVLVVMSHPCHGESQSVFVASLGRQIKPDRSVDHGIQSTSAAGRGREDF